MDQLTAAFPSLNDEQMAAVEGIGTAVQFSPNEVLIQQGEKDYPFFVIKSGQVRIVEHRLGREYAITQHGPRHFTGDVDMLTGRTAVISAIAAEPVKALQLCAKRLRRLMSECPALSDMLLEAFQTRRKLLANTEFVGVQLIGELNTAETSRMQEFFNKNHVPYTFYPADSEAGREELNKIGATDLPLPVVRCNTVTVSNPSLPKLANCIGISRSVEGEQFDLVIVGAGPAGLAAAVYASSEGIRTLVIDSVGPGGQAGSSSKIENFMGFPSGLSGSELANRGYLQALKFGTQFIAPVTVQEIEPSENGNHRLRLSTDETVLARCVLVASGVSYRHLDLPNFRRLEGAGVYFSATTVESRVCENASVIVVGGGNSAGQAAMFLANSAREVKVVIRGDDLAKSMSAYLCTRIVKHPKIQVLTNSQVVRLEGERSLDEVCIQNSVTDEQINHPCRALFTFIGATPHTAWLPEKVLLDDKGFVLTGSAIPPAELQKRWTLDRAPCDLETTVPGIMAAGDVRAGSTKRCGFAVGDGSLAVTCVHRYLSG